MIDPSDFFYTLNECGVDFYTGVPDSTLYEFCACIENSVSVSHVITANEGNAVAVATGYYLATGKIPLVYFQNSGLGNAMNPLLSLVDHSVYAIPMLLMIGWRGEPEKQDEPQHIKQGKILQRQLNILEIPYEIISEDCDFVCILRNTLSGIKKHKKTMALIIRTNTFSKYKNKSLCHITDGKYLTRKNVLNFILKNTQDCIILSTTGITSRELYELRLARGELQKDFLNVGSMGHVLSISLGVAISAKNKKIVCLDGDGSLIMHMGSMAITGSIKPENLIHILLDNNSHESVGGQKTVSDTIDFRNLSLSLGYDVFYKVENEHDLGLCGEIINKTKKLTLIQIIIESSSLSIPGRPDTDIKERKECFMRNFSE